MNTIQKSFVDAISAARPDVKFDVTSTGQPKNSFEKPRTYREGTVYMDAQGFPTITIGDKGGIGVTIPSWPSELKPFDVAITADARLAKLLARRAALKPAVSVGNPFADVTVDSKGKAHVASAS